MTDGDLNIFFEQQCDADACEMAAFPARDRDAFTAHWVKVLDDHAVTIKTVLFGGHVAGNIVSWERDRRQVVGYWIGREYWGKDIATKALSEFVTLFKARPLYAHVATHNIGSIRVLEKCGFTICREETESLDAPSDGVAELLLKLSASENSEAPPK